ncbi:NADH-dependent flavin oxidoreductase [Streptococcus entericus]|uniref:NADH-dependent flavin oxidoreductase n=1 Tax=Streptococcus entericus TaxID=155680 RepID=UPI00036975D9|nr:NADH-dependent flavin oxidoreductase [Streptococcus entericus]
MSTDRTLFTPLALPNGVQLTNRFVLSPMVTNSSLRSGAVSSEDLAYASRRANSAPLQISGAAYVDPYGQLFEYGFSVAEDEMVEGLSQLAQAMQADGSKAVLQLTHAGRFASHALTRFGFVYGPSPMSLKTPFPHEVRELTEDQIEEIIESYVAATRRTIQAGFAGVEISSAQRLLIQTFFSTFSNQRRDVYGCQTLETRAHLTLEIFRRVQAVIDTEAPDGFILGFRATPEETRGASIGYSIEEFCQLLDWLLDMAELDYLAIASWGREVYKNRVRSPGQNQGRLVTEVIHERFGDRLPIMATGGINTAEKAEEALAHADLVGLSTPFLVDPEFALKIETGQKDAIQMLIKPEDLAELAIPPAAFKDIVPLMDYGAAIPAASRDLFRTLESNYKEK